MKGKIRLFKHLSVGILIIMLSFSSIMQYTVRAETKKDSSVQWLIDSGILNSDFNIKEITKNPNQKITRQEFISLVVIAGGAANQAIQAKPYTYSDVNQIDVKLINYIGVACKINVTPALDEKPMLYPQKILTKQMAAYYLARYFNIEMDHDMEEYQDANSVSEVCRPYLNALMSSNIIYPESIDQIKPTLKMSWEGAARIIQSIYERGWYETKEVSYVMGKNIDSNSSTDVLLGVCGIDMDASTGIVYVVDTYHNQIKAYDKNQVTVIAGKDMGKDNKGRSIGGYRDGTCEDALFNQPSGICVVSGGIYIADTGNHSIRYIDLQKKTVSTYAGTGKSGRIDGKGTEAEFSSPQDLDIDSQGNVYVADTGNNSVRKIDTNGSVTTFAGKPYRYGYKDGEVDKALFNQPTGITMVDSIMYVADCGNQRIRMIADGLVSTYAGTSNEKDSNSNEYIGGYQDSSKEEAMFCYPTKITSAQDGCLYISDTGNGMIRKIQGDKVTTVAGFGQNAAQADFAWDNYFVQPSGLFYSMEEQILYVTDRFMNLVIGIHMN